MNKNIIFGLISVTSLVIGYNLYPMMNDVQPSEFNLDEIKLAENRDEQRVIDAGIKPKISLNKSQKIVTNKTKTEGSNAIQLLSINEEELENEMSVTESNVENVELMSELKQWSETHKIKLNDIINNNVDAKAIEPFKQIVFSDNSFHNDANIYQSSFEDEKWAYKLEEEIRYAITQHEFALDIELLNLECKQLVCELLIKEVVQGSWIPIYADIFPYLRGKGFIAHTDGVKQGMFRNGDENYYYGQYLFY